MYWCLYIFLPNTDIIYESICICTPVGGEYTHLDNWSWCCSSKCCGWISSSEVISYIHLSKLMVVPCHITSVHVWNCTTLFRFFATFVSPTKVSHWCPWNQGLTQLKWCSSAVNLHFVCKTRLENPQIVFCHQGQ